MDMLRAIFKTKTRDEWIAELADIDACVGPVYSLDEALHDPQSQVRGITLASGEGEAAFCTLPSFPRISSVTSEQRYRAPRLGEHTNEVFRSVAYAAAEIAQLRSEGAI